MKYLVILTVVWGLCMFYLVSPHKALYKSGDCVALYPTRHQIEISGDTTAIIVLEIIEVRKQTYITNGRYASDIKGQEGKLAYSHVTNEDYFSHIDNLNLYTKIDCEDTLKALGVSL